uniref:Thiamine-monophosphate kinase n=1 Tax=Cyanothece sp. (strain PCC 7425 / ATCC 29141) TaxID=395961 RepID=B8HTW5_CYAP4
MLVRDLGEQGLLKRLQAFCPPEIIGDDAAILTPTSGQSLVVTTDMLVDGVHFSDQTTAPEDVGWRAAAANLSDLAAMGASPLGLTIALGIPGDLAVEWIERLYQGMADCLAQSNTVLVGGDVCRSSVITVSITALGQVIPSQAILRSAAQPGDAILVTGVHGAARAGLELLLQSEWGRDLRESDRTGLILAHQRPRPRLDVIQTLRAQYPSVRVAGMDSSDGLADAILQICRASGVGAILDSDRLPLPAAFRHTQDLTPTQALDWGLYGGEDFELVLCLDAAIAHSFAAQIQGMVIGRMTTEPEVILQEGNQQRSLTLTAAFQHFSTAN